MAENVEEANEAPEVEVETPIDEQDARRAVEIDTHFNQLTDITDQVALVNSSYDSDLEESFDRMEKFIKDAMGWDLQELTPRALKTYLSHMSFHREIVAEIISEARRQLMEGRRGYLKRLVSYHKEFMAWFARVEKKYAA